MDGTGADPGLPPEAVALQERIGASEAIPLGSRRWLFTEAAEAADDATAAFLRDFLQGFPALHRAGPDCVAPLLTSHLCLRDVSNGSTSGDLWVSRAADEKIS